ncbi:Hypothetical_protein [Hexamita inflata]|uniref:Hypothetical_protein n=1 Tax=Hexamita inflata TaxID=28002 RepID=A0AA86UZD9_9EUKA|nr:Hypothetical protein HINF_LOCUS57977 [Hexamita inflata]
MRWKIQLNSGIYQTKLAIMQPIWPNRISESGMRLYINICAKPSLRQQVINNNFVSHIQNKIFPSSSPNLKITCVALESDCILNCPLSQICSQFDSIYCCQDVPPSFVPIMLSAFVLIFVFLFCCSNCKCEHHQNEPRNQIQMERDIIQTTEIETAVEV